MGHRAEGALAEGRCGGRWLDRFRNPALGIREKLLCFSVTSRREKHLAIRSAVRRSNRPIKSLLEQLMVHPDELALRLRRMLKLGKSPRRILKCIDDLETALGHRGVRMRVYFAALRREAERALKQNTTR